MLLQKSSINTKVPHYKPEIHWPFSTRRRIQFSPMPFNTASRDQQHVSSAVSFTITNSLCTAKQRVPGCFSRHFPLNILSAPLIPSTMSSTTFSTTTTSASKFVYFLDPKAAVISEYKTSTMAAPTVRRALAPAPLKRAATPSSAIIFRKQSPVPL